MFESIASPITRRKEHFRSSYSCVFLQYVENLSTKFSHRSERAGTVQLSHWEDEELFIDGDQYFDAFEHRIREAVRSITIEVYIFESDALGKRLLNALGEAVARGVQVRIVVDSVGSLHSKQEITRICADCGIEFQVYHELPWERAHWVTHTAKRERNFFQLLRTINKRNHRKVFIVDGEECFTGGMNISEVHLASIRGSNAWRDTTVRVRGPAIRALVEAFERLWARRDVRLNLQKRMERRRSGEEELVRLNDTRRARKYSFRELLRRVDQASARVWITAPYFVPHARLIRALQNAAKRGVDVRILLARRSDIFFMPWVAQELARPLLKSGAKVFEYLPRVLHAKVLLIDDWMTVGSSNLNHRSLVHDLEADIVITNGSTKESLATSFLTDLEFSDALTNESFGAARLWKRILARLILFLRYYL